VIDDDVAEDGSAFLVMDLLEGETIETRLLRRGKLWPGEVLPITYALLDVLAAAHDKAIVHRDIKPDNVFVTREGKVKLLDFGIARMIEPGRPRTTKSGATMGTPAFMPPEQARGRWDLLDGRTDLWAVGATMYIQLTGHQVREADTPNEELLLAMTEPAPSLSELRPDLPPALIELVDKALAFEQEDRWPNARAMQAAVRMVQDMLGAEGSLPIAAESSHPSSADSAAPVTLLTPHPLVSSTFRPQPTIWRRRKGGVVALGAALTLGALLIFNAFQTPPPRTAPVAAAPPVELAPMPTSVEPPPPVEPPAALVAAPGSQPAEPAQELAPGKQPAPSKPLGFKPSGARPYFARPHVEPKVVPVPSPIPAATVAPAAETPLPSNADPLDRRR
jgi:serine/threonine-protein kinase